MEGLPALAAEKIARNWYHMQPQKRKDLRRNSFSDLVGTCWQADWICFDVQRWIGQT